MRTPFKMLMFPLLLACAFSAGWWLRGLQSAPEPLRVQPLPTTLAPADRAVSAPPPPQQAPRNPGPTTQPQSPPPVAAPSPKPQAEQPAPSFASLLNQKAFSAAMNLYVETERRSANDAAELKKLALARLKTYLQEGDSVAFTGLADAFLSRYYSDLDVLLLLARQHLQSGYLAEAAHTYQLALNYAIGRPQQPRVQQAFNDFVHQVDQLLANDARWRELIGFYETLQLLDLTQPRYLLRQAELYLAQGETVYGRDLLQQLVAMPAVAAQAEALLAASSPVRAQVQPSRHSVALGLLGSHYHLPLMLNGTAVELIIDTGASTTTISRQKFEIIRHQSHFVELGPQMFNTANGVTKGVVYRVAEVKLGGLTLSDVHVAVLDFDMPPGIDGLLGMNVLSNFRFQVDQDEQRLYLQPRRS